MWYNCTTVVEAVHRLGARCPENKPRNFIIQFTSRVFKDKMWRAAKKSTFLRNKGLKFAEDLSWTNRENQMKFWPLGDEARKKGKAAHFVGVWAFANRKEIFPPGWRFS